MNKHEKPAGTPGNDVKFQAVCARIAAINDVGARHIEIKNAIRELNHEYSGVVIEKRVNQIIADNKKAAKAAAAAVAAQPDDIDQMVTEFNDEYALVSINGDVKVIREFINDQGRPDFELMKLSAFMAWTADHPKITVQHGNKTVEKAASSEWLEHPDHRKYEGVVFEPGVTEQPTVPGARWPRRYNIWKGWGVEPSEQGSCELFKTHLRDVHCNGDMELYTHIWSYLAHMFQRPMEKPSTCNAAVGDPGIGKTLFGEIIGKLVGAGYVPVTADLLKGNFNGHMKQAIWVQADEATYAHDKILSAKLKESITANTRSINDKNEKVYPVNAYDRQYYTVNKRDGLPVEKGDRRFAMAEPSNAHAEDTKYFGALMKQMKDGGYERLMYELMHADISDFDCHKCPKTEARARAIQEVADVEVSFMIDMAMTLELWDHDDDGFLEMDETLIARDLLREKFFKYAGARRLSSRATETKLGMMWGKVGIVGGHNLKTRLKEDTVIGGVLRYRNYRTNAYRLPDPQEMRDKLIAEHDLPKDCFANGAEIRRRPPGWTPPPIEDVDLLPEDRPDFAGGRPKRGNGGAAAH